MQLRGPFQNCSASDTVHRGDQSPFNRRSRARLEIDLAASLPEAGTGTSVAAVRNLARRQRAPHKWWPLCHAESSIFYIGAWPGSVSRHSRKPSRSAAPGQETRDRVMASLCDRRQRPPANRISMPDFISPPRNSASPCADMRGHHAAVRTPDFDTVKNCHVEKLDFRVVAAWDYADQKLARSGSSPEDVGLLFGRWGASLLFASAASERQRHVPHRISHIDQGE